MSDRGAGAPFKRTATSFSNPVVGDLGIVLPILLQHPSLTEPSRQLSITLRSLSLVCTKWRDQVQCAIISANCQVFSVAQLLASGRFLADCSNLQKLHLSAVDSSALLCMGLKQSAITTNCLPTISVTLDGLASKLLNLQELTISGIQIPMPLPISPSLEPLTRSTLSQRPPMSRSLTSLHLRSCQLQPQDWTSITSMTALRKLSLRGCRDVNVDASTYLHLVYTLPYLTHLELPTLCPAVLNALAPHRHGLRSLTVHSLTHADSECLLPSTMRELASLTHLQLALRPQLSAENGHHAAPSRLLCKHTLAALTALSAVRSLSISLSSAPSRRGSTDIGAAIPPARQKHGQATSALAGKTLARGGSSGIPRRGYHPCCQGYCALLVDLLGEHILNDSSDMLAPTATVMTARSATLSAVAACKLENATSCMSMIDSNDGDGGDNDGDNDAVDNVGSRVAAAAGGGSSRLGMAAAGAGPAHAASADKADCDDSSGRDSDEDEEGDEDGDGEGWESDSSSDGASNLLPRALVQYGTGVVASEEGDAAAMGGGAAGKLSNMTLATVFGSVLSVVGGALVELRVCGFMLMASQSLTAALARCSSLTHLELDGGDSWTPLVGLLPVLLSSGCPLRDLRLRRIKVVPGETGCLPLINQLTRLELRQLLSVSPASDAHDLTAGEVDVAVAAPGALGQLSCLSVLCLEVHHELPLFLAGLPSQEVLVFHESWLSQIADLPALTELRMLGTKHFSDDSWSRVGRLSSLRVLDLQDSVIGLEGLRALTRLKQLQELDVSGVEEPEALAGLGSMLAALTQLQVLALPRGLAPDQLRCVAPSVTDLDLAGIRMGPEQLASINHLSLLRRLDDVEWNHVDVSALWRYYFCGQFASLDAYTSYPDHR